MLFDSQYYLDIMDTRKCGPFPFGCFDFSIGSMEADLLSRYWLCHANGKRFAENVALGKSVIVTTGFGLTGQPHVGTIAQILRAIRFQKNGIPVQIVLGDLDAYNGKNSDIENVLALEPKFREFILKLGFDDTFPNILRNQYDAFDVLRDMYITGNYLIDEMFLEAKEDVHDFYSQQGKIDEVMSYRIKLSLNLMVADFLNLGMNHSFDSVLVSLGIDEYKYVGLAMSALMQIKQTQASFLKTFDLSGIFSTTLKGFNGFPKMGKSLPESGIFVGMSPEKVHRMIMEDTMVDCGKPEDNVVYQMMNTVSDFDSNKLLDAYVACKENGDKWKKMKEEYSQYLIEILSLWN